MTPRDHFDEPGSQFDQQATTIGASRSGQAWRTQRRESLAKGGDLHHHPWVLDSVPQDGRTTAIREVIYCLCRTGSQQRDTGPAYFRQDKPGATGW